MDSAKHGQASKSVGNSNVPPHQHISMHNGFHSHQRGHRSNNASINGYDSHSSCVSRGPVTAVAQPPLHDFHYKHERQPYIPMEEYLNSSALSTTDHGGIGAALSAAHGGSTRDFLNGDSCNHAKRHRGVDGLCMGGPPCSPHDDALMELARENLLLKRQLHVASLEVLFARVTTCRLSAILIAAIAAACSRPPIDHKRSVPQPTPSSSCVAPV